MTAAIGRKTEEKPTENQKKTEINPHQGRRAAGRNYRRQVLAAAIVSERPHR